jgi:GT2 family glycosyltransferase
METHPAAGASGSYYYNPDRSLQTSCYPFPTLAREAWRLFHLDRLKTYGVYDMEHWDASTPRSVDVLQGASLFLRRAALDQVGLFDPDYFMYTEEVDLCFRLQKAGWQLFWVPESGVIHLGGQSTRQAAQAMFIELYRSKHTFFRKQYGKASAGLYRFVLTLSALARLAAAPLAAFQPEPRRSQSRAVAANYRKLLQVLHEF